MAGDGDQIDVRIQQQIHGKVLLAVAGRYAPCGLLGMGAIAQGFEHCAVAANLGHLCIQAGFACLLEIDKLIDEHVLHQRPVYAIEGVHAFLPAFDVLGLCVPKIGRQNKHAVIEQLVVTQGFVVFVIFGGQPQRACLDAHIDVFRNQHHLALRVLLFKRGHHAQNLVVGLALGQRIRRQSVVLHTGLKEQVARGLAVAGRVQRDAFCQFFFGSRSHQCIEHAAGLAHVARHFVAAFFVAVHFLQHDQGQIDIVLFKPEQAGGVVHQHIGVEHEQFAGCGRYLDGGLAFFG